MLVTNAMFDNVMDGVTRGIEKIVVNNEDTAMVLEETNKTAREIYGRQYGLEAIRPIRGCCSSSCGSPLFMTVESSRMEGFLMNPDTSAKLHKKKRRNWSVTLLLVLAVAMLAVTIIIPVFVVIGMSFFHYNPLDMSHVRWNSFTSYRAASTDMEFIRTSGRTLAYARRTIFLQFFIGLGVVLLLNSGSLRGRKLFRSLPFLP